MSFADTATTGQSRQPSPEEPAEIEAVLALVLAEQPLDSWPQKPMRKLFGQAREQALNRAYVRGIVEGAFALQERLAADPTALDRLVEAANAGHEIDWGVPNAALVLNRSDYADMGEWFAAIERYTIGFANSEVTLALKRVRAARGS